MELHGHRALFGLRLEPTYIDGLILAVFRNWLNSAYDRGAALLGIGATRAPGNRLPASK